MNNKLKFLLIAIFMLLMGVWVKNPATLKDWSIVVSIAIFIASVSVLVSITDAYYIALDDFNIEMKKNLDRINYLNNILTLNDQEIFNNVKGKLEYDGIPVSIEAFDVTAYRRNAELEIGRLATEQIGLILKKPARPKIFGLQIIYNKY